MSTNENFSWVGTGKKGINFQEIEISFKKKSLTIKLSCGSTIQLQSPDNNPYIARVNSIYETKSKGPKLRVDWFYRPDDATNLLSANNRSNFEIPSFKGNEILISNHTDAVEIENIIDVCRVLYLPHDCPEPKSKFKRKDYFCRYQLAIETSSCKLSPLSDATFEAELKCLPQKINIDFAGILYRETAIWECLKLKYPSEIVTKVEEELNHFAAQEERDKEIERLKSEKKRKSVDLTGDDNLGEIFTPPNKQPRSQTSSKKKPSEPDTRPFSVPKSSNWTPSKQTISRYFTDEQLLDIMNFNHHNKFIALQLAYADFQETPEFLSSSEKPSILSSFRLPSDLMLIYIEKAVALKKLYKTKKLLSSVETMNSEPSFTRDDNNNSVPDVSSVNTPLRTTRSSLRKEIDNENDSSDGMDDDYGEDDSDNEMTSPSKPRLSNFSSKKNKDEDFEGIASIPSLQTLDEGEITNVRETSQKEVFKSRAFSKTTEMTYLLRAKEEINMIKLYYHYIVSTQNISQQNTNEIHYSMGVSTSIAQNKSLNFSYEDFKSYVYFLDNNETNPSAAPIAISTNEVSEPQSVTQPSTQPEVVNLLTTNSPITTSSSEIQETKPEEPVLMDIETNPTTEITINKVDAMSQETTINVNPTTDLSKPYENIIDGSLILYSGDEDDLIWIVYHQMNEDADQAIRLLFDLVLPKLSCWNIKDQLNIHSIFAKYGSGRRRLKRAFPKRNYRTEIIEYYNKYIKPARKVEYHDQSSDEEYTTHPDTSVIRERTTLTTETSEPTVLSMPPADPPVLDPTTSTNEPPRGMPIDIKLFPNMSDSDKELWKTISKEQFNALIELILKFQEHADSFSIFNFLSTMLIWNHHIISSAELTVRIFHIIDNAIYTKNKTTSSQEKLNIQVTLKNQFFILFNQSLPSDISKINLTL